MRHHLLLAGLAGLYGLTALPAQANEALSLMEESDKRMKAGDESVQYDMELYEGSALRHARKLVRLDKRFAAKNSTVVRFTEPAAVKNVSLLIEDTGAPVNDIWSYTPSTKNLRRISGAQKQNWFMGTEFTYEDFEDYKLKRYDFKLGGNQSPCLVWAKCTVVEATPKEGAEAAASGYARKRYLIEATSMFPVQVEYFDASGTLVKRLSTEGLNKHSSFYRPTAQTMHNLTNNRKTRLVLKSVTINSGLKDSQFSQRSLRDEEE